MCSLMHLAYCKFMQLIPVSYTYRVFESRCFYDDSGDSVIILKKLLMVLLFAVIIILVCMLLLSRFHGLFILKHIFDV